MALERKSPASSGPSEGSPASPERDGTALEIQIDRTRCIGSGNCGFWAPATFDLDDEGLAVVIDPDGDDETNVRKAAKGCPTEAISING